MLLTSETRDWTLPNPVELAGRLASYDIVVQHSPGVDRAGSRSPVFGVISASSIRRQTEGKF